MNLYSFTIHDRCTFITPALHYITHVFAIKAVDRNAKVILFIVVYDSH